MGGYLHLLQAPLGAAAAIEHRRGGSGAGAILVAAFATVAKRTMRISVMCQRRIVH